MAHQFPAQLCTQLALRTVAASAFAASLLIGLPGPASADSIADTDGRSDILIADQFNNRVIQVDPRTHAVVWQFGDGGDHPGPHSVVGVNDAERVGPYTLISGTGTPPSNPPLPGCSDPVNGCPDNRVFLVDRHGLIVWQYGQNGGVAGAGPDQLNTPVQAAFVSDFPGHPGFTVVITDQGNQRVIAVDLFSKHIVWQYGTTGVPGSGHNELSNPNSAEVLENGHILIADENNNRVLEVTRDRSIVHRFTAGGTVNGAAFASRLHNGHTLITDSNNNRIIEVDRYDQIVWQYATNKMPGSNPNPSPTRAVRLHNGNTLISDQFNQRVLEITEDGRIAFQQGMLNSAGAGADRLNGPYDAKVIGDYTGLTPPFAVDADGSEDSD